MFRGTIEQPYFEELASVVSFEPGIYSRWRL
jgi:hypothetical protein